MPRGRQSGNQCQGEDRAVLLQGYHEWWKVLSHDQEIYASTQEAFANKTPHLHARWRHLSYRKRHPRVHGKRLQVELLEKRWMACQITRPQSHWKPVGDPFRKCDEAIPKKWGRAEEVFETRVGQDRHGYTEKICHVLTEQDLSCPCKVLANNGFQTQYWGSQHSNIAHCHTVLYFCYKIKKLLIFCKPLVLFLIWDRIWTADILRIPKMPSGYQFDEFKPLFQPPQNSDKTYPTHFTSNY